MFWHFVQIGQFARNGTAYFLGKIRKNVKILPAETFTQHAKFKKIQLDMLASQKTKKTKKKKNKKKKKQKKTNKKKKKNKKQKKKKNAYLVANPNSKMTGQFGKDFTCLGKNIEYCRMQQNSR